MNKINNYQLHEVCGSNGVPNQLKQIKNVWLLFSNTYIVASEQNTYDNFYVS